MTWYLKIFLICNFNVLGQDILSLAESALSNPSPSIAKIREDISKNIREESGILGKWHGANPVSGTWTWTFRPDGTFVSVGKQLTLNGTWELKGTAFSAKLPDNKGYVSHIKGTFQPENISYTYYVTHPEKGRSGESNSQTMKKLQNGL